MSMDILFTYLPKRESVHSYVLIYDISGNIKSDIK